MLTIGRWHLHAVLNQKIHTAIKDQTRLPMHPRHRGDLGSQVVVHRFIKGREAMKIQNDLLMSLTRAIWILDTR